MDLYILRHGIAEDRHPTGRDRDRVLTPEGREKTAAAGKALLRLGVSFDLMLSSPFARAWETAEIIAEELDCRKRLRPCEALGSGAPPAGVLNELQQAWKKDSSVLAVGHEPDLSRLISILLAGSPGLAITMKKGALAKLTLAGAEPGAARLEWLLGPKHLCRIG